MAVVYLVCCDRCGREIRRTDNVAEMVQDAACRDLSIQVPWAPELRADYAVLCDECRVAVAGYLTAVLKLDRAAVFRTAVGNGGTPLPLKARDAKEPSEAPPPPVLPLVETARGVEPPAGDITL